MGEMSAGSLRFAQVGKNQLAIASNVSVVVLGLSCYSIASLFVLWLAIASNVSAVALGLSCCSIASLLCSGLRLGLNLK